MAVTDIGVAILAAILIVLGIRGTYASVWNSLFPNYAIALPSASSSNSSNTTGPARVIPGPGGVYTPQIVGGNANSSAPSSTPYLGSNPLPGYHGSSF